MKTSNLFLVDTKGSMEGGNVNPALAVRGFTEAAQGYRCMGTPTPLTKREVLFLVKMICEETKELLHTVSDNPLEDFLTCARESKAPATPQPVTQGETVLEQADAFVDIIYFILNAASKNGINCDEVFTEVHAANMNKRFPDGTFHRDQDGKIIKPEGWQPADLKVVLNQWYLKGSWPDRRTTQ